MSHIDELSHFRVRLAAVREQNRLAWERSRRLVSPAETPKTIQRLSVVLGEHPSLSATLKQTLQESLRNGTATRIQDLPADALRHITGLPATKAVRALCVFFGMLDTDVSRSVSRLSSEEIEQFVRCHANPYDLLLKADVASLLDLGAGDLSFIEAVVDQYGPGMETRKTPLVLHAVDRLRPGSSLGGPLHPPETRLKTLGALGEAVQFRFWGNLDMFALNAHPQLWPRYTIVTCHAPATPTFAYEPRRIDETVIARHLAAAKGHYRQVRLGGEAALEVQAGGKALLFPPWKFEIRGPLALLDLLSHRGKLCVLSSIDTEVFWELVSQLVEDPAVRPKDVVFTADMLPRVFGTVYSRLSALPLGEPISLADVVDLRQDSPRVLQPLGTTDARSYRFRAVLIRRGATFPGMPASLTGRLFKEMKQELMPWFMVLIP